MSRQENNKNKDTKSRLEDLKKQLEDSKVQLVNSTYDLSPIPNDPTTNLKDKPNLKFKDTVERYIMFGKYYVWNGFNATQAATLCGYSNPHYMGTKLLAKPIVQDIVRQEKDNLIKAYGVTRETFIIQYIKLLEDQTMSHKDRLLCLKQFQEFVGYNQQIDVNVRQAPTINILPVDGKVIDIATELNIDLEDDTTN